MGFACNTRNCLKSILCTAKEDLFYHVPRFQLVAKFACLQAENRKLRFETTKPAYNFLAKQKMKTNVLIPMKFTSHVAKLNRSAFNVPVSKILPRAAGSVAIKDLFFCSVSGKVLKPPTVLTLNSPKIRRGNIPQLTYFEILGIDAEFETDLELGKKNYRKLQASLHPDKFSNSSQEEQEFSQEISSMVNDALTVLLSPYLRAKYLSRIVFNDITVRN